MAEKMGSVVYYTKGEGEEATTAVAYPGDDVPKELSKEQREQMRRDGRIVDEEWLSEPDPRTGTRLVLPPEEVRNQQIARRTPVRAPSDMVFTDDEERRRQAERIEKTAVEQESQKKKS